MNRLDWNRIFRAVGYFAVILAGVIKLGGVPETWQQWVLAICTAIAGGYGKYSTSTRLIMPNREPWPNERRIVEAQKEAQK